MFKLYRRWAINSIKSNAYSSGISPVVVFTTAFVGMITLLTLAVAFPSATNSAPPIYIAGEVRLSILVIIPPIALSFLFFALAILDWFIKINVKYITNGDTVPNRIIFSKLFTCVDIEPDNCYYPNYRIRANESTAVNVLNWNNFVVPVTALVYGVVLIYALPVLLWVLALMGVWFAIVKLARVVYSISTRFSKHENDPNAHNHKEPQ